MKLPPNKKGMGFKKINLVDVKYLSLKYRNLNAPDTEDQEQVYYDKFYSDYE